MPTGHIRLFSVLLLSVWALAAGCGPRPLVLFHQYPEDGTTVKAGGELVLNLAFNQEVMEVPNKTFTVTENGKVVFSTAVRSPAISSYSPSVQIVTGVTLRAGHTYLATLEEGAYIAAHAPRCVSPKIVASITAAASIGYNGSIPSKPSHMRTVQPLLDRLKESTIQKYEHNALYSGEAAAAHLRDTFKTIFAPVAGRSSVQEFSHPFLMPSGIFSLLPDGECRSPSASCDVVVIGAHLDTINRQNWTINVVSGQAPGADDDGSGVGLLVAFAMSLVEGDFKPTTNTQIEFHLYSGEEEGLYGSAYVAADYARRGVRVRAMLMIDQAGWVRNPQAPVAAYFTDMTDPEINRLIIACSKQYVPELPLVESNEDGRAASDFYSWSTWGYRTGYVAEGPIDDIVYGNAKHTATDVISGVNFTHALRVGKIVFSTAMEIVLSTP